MKSNKLFPEENPEIVQIYKIIKKFGHITQENYLTYLKRREMGIWELEDILEWAKAFYEDPWRVENKQYRSVGYFLRDPERYSENIRKEEKPWTL